MTTEPISMLKGTVCTFTHEFVTIGMVYVTELQEIKILLANPEQFCCIRVKFICKGNTSSKLKTTKQLLIDRLLTCS